MNTVIFFKNASFRNGKATSLLEYISELGIDCRTKGKWPNRAGGIVSLHLREEMDDLLYSQLVVYATAEGLDIEETTEEDFALFIKTA